MKKLLVCLLAALMLITLMAGCAQDSAEETTTTDETATDQVTTDEGTTDEVTEEVTYKIGFSFPTKNNEFWTKSLDFVNYVAEALDVDVNAQDCNNSQEEQLADVENMIADGIQGLVLAPQDASVCAGISSMCKEKDIPLMIADRWPGDDLVAGEDYLAFIGPNDITAGQAIATALIEGGCTNIVALGGYDGTSVAEGRKDGLELAMSENPDVTLLKYEAVGESMDEADAAIRNLLQTYPELDGVWCYNDSLALASVNVLKEKGILADVKVGGMDLLGPAVESIKAGELYFSTGGHWMQTGFALIMVFDALHDIQPTETLVKLDLLAVTLDNMEAFDAKYGEGMDVDVQSMSRTYNPDAVTYFELSLD
ncbi:MAG: substrate-binding domain-containing protein [Eubacteriales bacterium]|nr:substrate-binding domain-containing protein [Eubacteriales bacterium]